MVHWRLVRIKNVFSQNDKRSEIVDYLWLEKYHYQYKKDKDTFKKRGSPLQKMLKLNFKVVPYWACVFINVIQTKIRTVKMFFFSQKIWVSSVISQNISIKKKVKPARAENKGARSEWGSESSEKIPRPLPPARIFLEVWGIILIWGDIDPPWSIDSDLYLQV